MRDSGFSVDNSPTRVVPGHASFVLHVVALVGETTLNEVKVHAIHRHQLWQEQLLRVLLRLRDGIPEDEASFLRAVTMLINIVLEATQGMLVKNCVLGGQNRGVFF